jgi:stage II sporulation protein AA (anti-sigma F factor antagonist)
MRFCVEALLFPKSQGPLGIFSVFSLWRPFFDNFLNGQALQYRQDKERSRNMPAVIYSEKSVMNVLLTGEIDHHSAAQMREKIDLGVESILPKELVLDFSGVTFMDSSGIGLIMGRYKLMQSIGGSLRVINAPAAIQKIMRLSGLDLLKVIY